MTATHLEWRGQRGYLGEHRVVILDHDQQGWWIYTELPGDPPLQPARSGAEARAAAETWLGDWLRKAGLTS